MSPRDAFIDALRAVGLESVKPLRLDDGRIERFRVTGDKAGSLNGWAVFHDQRPAFGAFGSWRTGESHTWHDSTASPTTAAERAEHHRQRELRRRQRLEAEAMAHAKAAARAVKLWECGKPATNAHPYLQIKRVRSYGLRTLGAALMVPVRHANGTLSSLQFIKADCEKKFLSGGNIRGCYCPIGRPVNNTLLIAEGYATAATLHQVTGHAVAIAFNAGNLIEVARLLRQKFPTSTFVLCADDDRATPGNRGITAARAAAAAVGGVVAIPEFEGVQP